jgi:hypothetical protein
MDAKSPAELLSLSRDDLLSLPTFAFCRGCADCWDCLGCADCSVCLRCSGCSDCVRCADCSGCSGCTDCVGIAGAIGLQYMAYGTQLTSDEWTSLYETIKSEE